MTHIVIPVVLCFARATKTGKVRKSQVGCFYHYNINLSTAQKDLAKDINRQDFTVCDIIGTVQHWCFFAVMHDTVLITSIKLLLTVDGFIFVGINFHGLNKSDTFVWFKIRGLQVFFLNTYQKVLFRWYWTLIRTSTNKGPHIVHLSILCPDDVWRIFDCSKHKH